jgi:hypothetical protein
MKHIIIVTTDVDKEIGEDKVFEDLKLHLFNYGQVALDDDGFSPFSVISVQQQT